MKTTRNRKAVQCGALIVVGFVLLLWPVARSLAQGVDGAAATYTLVRWTVDGGGVTGRAAGAYVLSGTAGQPDAETLSGHGYTLGGGFWGGGEGTAGGYSIYLPLVLRQ